MDRYVGRPFLKLLESYILDILGELDPIDRRNLEGMQVKLSKVYSMDGTWQKIVSAQMGFPEDFPKQVRDIWGEYLRQAETTECKGRRKSLF